MLAIFRKIFNFCIIACIVAVSGGCSTISPPKPAESYFDNTKHDLSAVKLENEWWSAYNLPLLDRLVLTALEKNADFAKSFINIQQAIYKANLAGADLFPTPSFLSRGSISKEMKTSEPSIRSLGAEIKINYELDIWRKLSNITMSKEFEYKGAIEDYHSAKLTLVNSVVEGFLSILYLNSAIFETNLKIKNYESIYLRVQIKYTNGKLAANDANLALRNIFWAKQELIYLENERKKEINLMYVYLNTPVKTRIFDEIKSLYITDIKSIGVNIDVPMSVLSRRPDVKSAEYKLFSLFYDVKVAYKDLYPSVSIETSLTSTSNSAGSALKFPTFIGEIQLRLPFLDWNHIKWNIKISESEYEKARIDFEDTLSTALNELDLAYFLYSKAKEYYTVSESAYSTNSSIFFNYESRYKAGSGEMTDLLESVNNRIDAKLELLRSHYELIRLETTMYKIMAGRYL